MDSDDEYDEAKGRPPTSLAERRRAQKAIFEAWIISDAGLAALTKPEGSKSHDINDEDQSIHALMARIGTQIIKNPRDYQTELFERAKRENTIAVLDTGSGKTLIAVMLLRDIIDQELEDRARNKAPRISFFLVASVTLAYQQFSVLETNLDHKVTRVCGSDNADIWDKSKWLHLFTENKVIVCTADILLLCLSRSFIGMREINLVIFDEAHHAKKNHAYARILKEFYFEENKSARPRIFGMTASPIDAKTDVTQAANELEAVLDAKIATTLDMSLTDAVKKPIERILTYAALSSHPQKSPLVQAAKLKFGHIESFQRPIESWPQIARELGSWCADQYLIDKLSEKRLRRYEASLEQKYHKRGVKNVQELDSAIAELKFAVNFMEQECAKLAMLTSIEPSDLSSKVLELQEYLSGQFERETTQRCIVFVDKRDSARLLNLLFQKIGTRHMRSAYLIGGNNGIDEDSFSFKQQVMTLIKFRKGELNCLFATSVAEEGLDVPDCNLVVRFNIAQTMIQYVQSRGRARQQNSKFLHMVEKGNSIHQEQVMEQRYQEMAMRKFCQALPEDRRLLGNEDTLEALLSKEKGMRVYVEPSTGAKLTYGNALVYLANFVSSLQQEAGEPQHPTYNVLSKGSKFISEVVLPGNGPLPLRSAIGRICTKKGIAKRSAAFEACLELRKHQHLDEHLLPKFHKKLPVLRNALLAVDMNKANAYSMRTKPTVWARTRGTLPNELWVTIIDFPDGLDHQHQPLAFLTRNQLPQFPSFPIFLNDLRESTVVSRQLRKPLTPDEVAINHISAFTFRVFKDVFSKTYEPDPKQLSYWLAPATISTSQSDETEATHAIDWSLLEKVFQNEEYSWSPDISDSSLLNQFLVDRFDGSRKFYSIAVDDKLKPHDPVPEDAAKTKHKHEGHILGFSVSLWKKARERSVWNPKQPVIVAEQILTRRNLLASPNSEELSVTKKAYLCPEPLKISALPPSVATSCLVWPGVIHRLESYMIAIEASNMIGVICEPRVALAAITKDSDNSGEHDNPERINFQSGMGENYERLEFIGDTFLKSATTISTFIQNPNDNEFDFHVKRMRLLCNKNLFNVAKEMKLYEYIRSKAFTRRIWYPEGLKLLEGKGVNQQREAQTHSLNDKTIADVSEALIGAAFVSHDKPGETWHEDQWENAVRAVAKLTTPSNVAGSDMLMHTMTKWDEYRTSYTKPDYQIGDVTASQRDLAEKIEVDHSYRFKYPRLLRSAFIHPSQPVLYEKLPNYQRLEFLGDALLDMASITHIFYRFPEKDPQWLTEHKMAMVSNKFLGAVSVNIGFHKHLRHSSAIIEHQIAEYVTELLEAKRTAGDSRDYWTTVSDPPKCLPDIVESFVGAMFIDSNFDYNVVQNFFDKYMKWYFEDMSIYDTYANNHPCTHLHNLLQATYGCQDYRVMAKELPPEDGIDKEKADIVAVVMIHNEIVAYSKGKSAKYARLRVANHAIKEIEGFAPFEFRSKYGCHCSVAEN